MTPFGWDLPPGCSLADVEGEGEGPGECMDCGRPCDEDETLCTACAARDARAERKFQREYEG